MKIVVLDGYTMNPGDMPWEPLERLGELTVYDRTPAEQVISRIGDAEVILVNKVQLTKEIFDQCPSIKYVGVMATGYNNVDAAAATAMGITVTNVPTYGTNAVGQFAIALLLEICHHVGAHSDAVHAGDWTNNLDWSFWNYPLIELAGKTYGVIGFGRIGQTSARIAEALGMKILVYDAFPNKDYETENCKYVSLDELYEKSDVISLHCPLFPDTKGMINTQNIAKMKDGVIILNTSRGPLVVEQDLADALESGKVYAAGLDVAIQEPINADSPLLKAKNCFITPHIAGAAFEARQRRYAITVENIEMYLKGTPVNIVTK